MARPGPTLRSQWLGEQIRELRDAAGYSRKQVAEIFERDVTTYGRYETGEYPLRKADLLALFDLFGVRDPKQRDQLLDLHADAWQEGWYDGWNDIVDRPFVDYAWLEQRARTIQTYEAMLVAGLLQTQAYARAVIQNTEDGAADEDVERWLELRMQRQELWFADRTKHLETVLDEAVLHRHGVVSIDVQRDQLRHLLDLGKKRRIQIRVVPFDAKQHAGLDGPFTIFRPAEPWPTVAYVETIAGQLFAEGARFEPFEHAYARLRASSLEPGESAALIKAIAEDLS